MIDILADKMAVGIKHRAPDHPASVAVLKHSLAILINTVSILALTLTIGLFTSKLSETVVVLLSFSALRMVSGGLHLRSGTWCVIVTTTIVFLVSRIQMGVTGIWIFTGLSLLLAMLFAPTDIHKQSRIPKKYYPALKVASVLLVLSNFFINSPVVAGSFFVQTILLIPRKGVKNK